MIEINIGIYQTRNLPPKVSGKGQDQTHNRILFREQKDPSQQHDTIQVFVTDEQLEKITEQSLDVLPEEVSERICQAYLDKLEDQAA